MEIISPASLWKDFDRRRVPLNVNRISTRDSKGFRVTSLYYTATETADGCVRVFAKLYTPLHAPNAPIIIYFNDIQKSIDEHSTLRESLENYAFLCIDYAGRHDERVNYTIFPASLKHLNYFEYPNSSSDYAIDVKRASRYIWALMAKRAITLVEFEFPNARGVGMVGVGLGGCPVFKACAFEEDLMAGMTIYSAGYIAQQGTRPLEYTSFKAALDCESYAPFVNVPLLMLYTTNERNGSMDYMNDVFDSIASDKCRLSVVERTNRSVSVKQRRNALMWFDYHIRNEGKVPKLPIIRSLCSDGRLYIETEIDVSSETSSVELYVSRGNENTAYRNWGSTKVEMVGDGQYLAKVSVYDAKTPIYAFVNVKYKKGLSLSSHTITCHPDRMGVRGEDVRPTRLVYDSDMGLDDWTVLNDSGTDEIVKLTMEEGPLEITGVSSSTNSISTFKVSERTYKSFKDSALQFLIYSLETQDVTFVVSIKNEGEYFAIRRLSQSTGWTTVTLSATDFKSRNGTLKSFEDIILLEINSKSARVIVSSVLWV